MDILYQNSHVMQGIGTKGHLYTLVQKLQLQQAPLERVLVTSKNFTVYAFKRCTNVSKRILEQSLYCFFLFFFF